MDKMKECFEQIKKNGWVCSTEDKKIFRCVCCNFRPYEDCKSKFYEHAFHIHPRVLQNVWNFYEDDFFYDEYDEGDNQTSIEIEHLEHMYDVCKMHHMLPLTCQVLKKTQNETLCHCQYQDKEKPKVDGFMFKTNDFWNEHPCEITEEHNILLHNETSFQTKLWLTIMMLIFLFLFPIIYYIYKKFYQRIVRSRNEDNISLVMM